MKSERGPLNKTASLKLGGDFAEFLRVGRRIMCCPMTLRSERSKKKDGFVVFPYQLWMSADTHALTHT